MFGKLKQALGIGTVKVELTVPGQVSKAGNSLNGTVRLIAKSDQEVTNIRIKLIESFTTGRGDERKTKEFTLGEMSLPQQLLLKDGEVKDVEFTLGYKILKSGNDNLKEMGGAFGALGKLGAMADNEKSEYHITAVADVKGTALDPSDRKAIRLID